MSSADNVQGVPREVVIEFFKHTLPFNELDDSALQYLAKFSVIAFYPRGTVVS